MGLAATALLVAIGCFLGARADTWLQFPGTGTAVFFPPYAIVTAALLRTPARRWWVVLLAASVGDFVPHRQAGASLTFALLTEIPNHLRALIAAVGLRRFGGRPLRLDSLRGMLAFFAFAVALAPCATALMGAGIVAAHHPGAPYWLAWQQWTLSNALTALAMLPVIVIVVQRLETGRIPLRPGRVVEASLLLIGLLVVDSAVFTSSYGQVGIHPARLYWPLPFLLWAAVRFGPAGISAALLVVASLTVWGAVHRRGPFAVMSPADDLVELQLFLLAIALPLLALSALLRQQQKTAAALHASRLQYDGARESDRRKDEFLAMLGHELRNPLAPIGIALDIMREAPPGSGHVTWAREAIQRQLAQLTRLVDDLLDISRVTLGKIRLRLDTVDMSAVVMSAVETTRPLIDSCRHRVSLTMPDSRVRLRGDAVRLTQVVANLLNNAAKYTEPGGRIAIAVHRVGDEAVLSVRDNGIGVAPESLGEIFELFRQAPATRERWPGGLGVGLTLVKRLVELHGGSVQAFSAGPQQGTEIIVRLPATAEDQLEPQDVAPPQPADSPPGSLRILAVDDNVDVADGLARVLGTRGHMVRTAHDGVTALELADTFAPDVVLLDLGLPRLDGLEVARRLRRSEGKAGVLLVSMSGFGQEQTHVRSSQAGFDHHVVKPVDIDGLQSLLDAHARTVAARVDAR
jgi:signal transduction histidine kinase/ActR/RegA family two-component response regulator